MALQSSTSTLDNVLPAMDFILEMFEDGKERFKDNDFMAPCINSAWSKLNKYYTKTSESPAYISALVLHPAFKWEYIEATWDPEWIPKSREQVEELWKRYQPVGAPTITSFSSESSSQLKSNQFCDWKHKKQAAKQVTIVSNLTIKLIGAILGPLLLKAMNTYDISEYLLITTLKMFASGGLSLHSKETTRISLKWP
jgi:hypothetical protein